jgi:hypothetical protein
LSTLKFTSGRRTQRIGRGCQTASLSFGPRRCYWGTDLTNSFNKATYRQRITHFTETLDFMSADDKRWVMGDAIRARLWWT